MNNLSWNQSRIQRNIVFERTEQYSPTNMIYWREKGFNSEIWHCHTSQQSGYKM